MIISEKKTLFIFRPQKRPNMFPELITFTELRPDNIRTVFHYLKFYTYKK